MSLLKSLQILSLIVGTTAHTSMPPSTNNDKSTKEYWKNQIYTIRCSIMNGSGKSIREFPGTMCLFLDDGSFITAIDNSLQRIDSKMKELWRLPGHFHHQITLSEDKKTILALGSEVQVENEKRVRYDTVLKIDLKGKVIAKKSGFELLEPEHRSANPGPMIWDENYKDAEFENSHFNSVNEVPPNDYGKKLPEMKSGNIITNNAGGYIYILDPNLEKVLFRYRPESARKALHDVQVNSKGQLMYVNNEREDKDSGRYSTVEFYDPIKKSVVFEFTAKPKEMFYTPICGGLQLFENDYLVFSDVVKGLFVHQISKSKMIYTSPNMGYEEGTYRFRRMQQIKRVDLTKFLAHWK